MSKPETIPPVKITILTPTLNSARTITDCLQSVNSQTYPDVDQIIIDGNSSDNTLDLVKSVPNRVSNIVSEPDNGLYDAINKGISMASGDVIGILNADDFYDSDNVLAIVADQFSTSSCDIVYGDLCYVNKKDMKKIVRNWKSRPFSPDLLKQGWMPPHPTFFAKRELYQMYGIFDTSLRISADYDLMLRFLKQKELKIQYIPEVLIHMRMGGQSNKSLANIIQKSREDWKAIKKNGTGNWLTLARKNTSKIRQFL